MKIKRSLGWVAAAVAVLLLARGVWGGDSAAGPRRVDLRTYVPPLNPVFETADPNATPGDTNYFGPQGLVDATPGPFWTPRPT
ncbi:MAG: hypothetical protein OEV06_07050, partial [Anaerolineae bacterium]|nr:hypothetical protein [Anaerolineae bacterium]